MIITLKVKKVTVIESIGTDDVCLELDELTPYPSLHYPGLAKISTRKGYGQEWCKKVLNVDPEIIKI